MFHSKNETCYENLHHIQNPIQEISHSLGPLSFTISFILSFIFTGLVGTVAIQKISSKTEFSGKDSKSSVRIPSLPSLPIVGPFYPLLWKGNQIVNE